MLERYWRIGKLPNCQKSRIKFKGAVAVFMRYINDWEEGCQICQWYKNGAKGKPFDDTVYNEMVKWIGKILANGA